MSIAVKSALSLWCLGLSLSAQAASRPVHETRAAPAQGTVEIINAAGSVEVRGWDAAQVDVSGDIDELVEKVEVTQSGDRTTVRAVSAKQYFSLGRRGAARLLVQIPKGSALVTDLVSSDLVTTGVLGRQTLHTVSGDIRGNAAADLQVSTVSGDFTLELGLVNHASFESVSGDQHVSGTLAAGGRLAARAVSGDVHVELKDSPNADIDASTVSGDIANCTAPAPVQPEHGPGSYLHYRRGQGGGDVRLETTSGDIDFCAR